MKSGKTTVAEFLEREMDCDVQIHGVAGGIREIVFNMFHVTGLMPDSLIEQETKSARHPCGKTFRQILQEVGAKMREIWPDVWLDYWKQGCHKDTVVIVPDVRFPNEVKAIQDMGGIVIRLTRNPVDSLDETETAVDGHIFAPAEYCSVHGNALVDRVTNKGTGQYFDYIVDNEVMSIDETNETVLKIVKEYLA